MIGSLRGVLLDRVSKAGGAEVLVEVGGVGYRATLPTGTAVGLGELGSPVFLHVHTHVREDAIVLYGFATREERRCFEALIGAHGVGPAVALAILSVHAPPVLRGILATDDVDALTLVPGIGKKTAVRLLIELKARLDVEIDGDEASLVAGPFGLAGAVLGPRAEVRAALASLGYANDEVRDILATLPDEGDAAELLKQALRGLAATR